MAGGMKDFSEERAVKYILLNKDVVIAEFMVDTVFDTITILEYSGEVVLSCLPCSPPSKAVFAITSLNGCVGRGSRSDY